VASTDDGVVPDPTALYRVRDGAYAADLMIAAVAEFDLFSWLAGRGPVTVAAVCAGLGLADRPADVLLTLCAAHGLVDRDPAGGDTVTLTPLGRAHLAAGSRYDVRPYYRSLAERPGVRELAEVLRTDRPAAWASAAPPSPGPVAGPVVGAGPDPAPAPVAGPADWAGRLADAAFAERITAAMDARGAFLGPRLAAAVADLPISRLLDVGGSSGVYTAALLADRPDARGTVLERPPVDAAARTLVWARGQAARIEVVTGDMFTEALPAGHDAHLYSQVLHDWDRHRVRRLLAASFAALQPGGWLIDHDAHLDADKRGPLPVAEYSVLLMHSTPGRCWSVGELAEMATGVGFVDPVQRPAAADRSVFLARKPG
jgi:3-hydroxy-5-methyl-1-naphthoate 3-O-methyltransferase